MSKQIATPSEVHLLHTDDPVSIEELLRNININYRLLNTAGTDSNKSTWRQLEVDAKDRQDLLDALSTSTMSYILQERHVRVSSGDSGLDGPTTSSIATDPSATLQNSDAALSISVQPGSDHAAIDTAPIDTAANIAAHHRPDLRLSSDTPPSVGAFDNHRNVQYQRELPLYSDLERACIICFGRSRLADLPDLGSYICLACVTDAFGAELERTRAV